MAKRGVILHCHEGHRSALLGDVGFRKLDQAGLVRPYDEAPFLTATGLRLEPIELRHDGGPTFGFRIEVSTGRRQRPVSVGYVADTGCWSDRMADCLSDVDVLGVEFNHDVGLQRSSPRPDFLIARNLGDRGHLSNDQGAELLHAILARSGASALRHVVLLHLSEQCNDPAIAIDAADQVLLAAGRRAEFMPRGSAPRFPTCGSLRARSVLALSTAPPWFKIPSDPGTLPPRETRRPFWLDWSSAIWTTPDQC